VNRAAKTGLLSAGAVGTAIAASVCCVGPLVLAVLGLGGGALLLKLGPYRPYFLVVTAGLLFSAFYLTYRRPEGEECGPLSACARPASRKGQKITLVIATILVLLAAVAPYFSEVLF
jgi:mercuric ion transport protein